MHVYIHIHIFVYTKFACKDTRVCDLWVYMHLHVRNFPCMYNTICEIYVHIYSCMRDLRAHIHLRVQILRNHIISIRNLRAYKLFHTKFVRMYTRKCEICAQALWKLLNNRALCSSVHTWHPPDARHLTFSCIILVNMEAAVYVCVSASVLFIYSLYFLCLTFIGVFSFSIFIWCFAWEGGLIWFYEGFFILRIYDHIECSF